MFIYTSDQIKKIDQEAEQSGMSPFSLMENAGSGLYRKIITNLSEDDRILILAGKGNNGGDGIVLSRYLKNQGYVVDLVFPMGMPKTNAAKSHLYYYQACGYLINEFNQSEKYDVVIDAILGVGAALPLMDNLSTITKWVNEQKAKIISIDIPTGVSSNSGEVDAYAIKSDITYCLHGYKPSAFLFPSSDYYGVMDVVEIGLKHNSNWKVWTEKDVIHSLPKREKNTHKGTYGTGLLIAGSDEMPGSAALAAIGAIRFGIGKLSIATTKHASTIIAPLVPEATYYFREKNDVINANFSCVAIGPGLTPDDELEDIISSYINKDVPLILDAGALTKRIYEDRNSSIILTPHPGEFSRMTEVEKLNLQQNRIQLASEYAVQNGVTVVLKGHNTVIAYSDGSGVINSTGNTGLAKGGTGDTLTGMLLASLSNDQNIKSAIANAVFLHGYCADEWIKTNGERTLTAHDFHTLLAKVVKRIEVLSS
ncbi:NAD(P)H-hydrate dehydratase [Bacillus sp. 03113]|uniref:NAD(P)H-hydrate dehydratase n=1 Tax=Bacillus sp. 03113 TaxID=2578211 RepID=UPI001143410F|nr:NAD(P)H-hydrate dehydratase [Bacillus sp. 03113]